MSRPIHGSVGGSRPWLWRISGARNAMQYSSHASRREPPREEGPTTDRSLPTSVASCPPAFASHTRTAPSVRVPHPHGAVRQAADDLALPCSQVQHDAVLPAQSPFAREGRTARPPDPHFEQPVPTDSQELLTRRGPQAHRANTSLRVACALVRTRILHSSLSLQVCHSSRVIMIQVCCI